MWPKQNNRYQSLPQLETPGENLAPTPESVRRRIPYWLQQKTTILLLCTNFTTFLALAFSLWRSSREGGSPGHCIQQFSTPCRPRVNDIVGMPSNDFAAPALPAVHYLSPQLYQADFRQTNNWRAEPGVHSDKVDVAWHYIELGAGGIRLTEDEMHALNKTETPEKPWHKVPKEHGGGYLAMLEVFHLLHCLVSRC